MTSNRRKSVREMVAELKSEYGITINAQTVRNRMHEAGVSWMCSETKAFYKEIKSMETCNMGTQASNEEQRVLASNSLV